jgi:hypothetical protein
MSGDANAPDDPIAVEWTWDHVESLLAAAERRGYERAVTRLRDRDAFHAWRHPDPAPWQRKPEPREPNVLAADYLDAVKESTDG